VTGASPVTTGWTLVNQELIDTLITIGGYTHPLFQPTDEQRAQDAAPMMGQGVLLLAGGMAERSGTLNDVIALLGFTEVRFSTMVRGGQSIRLTMEPGATIKTTSGKRRSEYRWTVRDKEDTLVLEATVLMLRKREEDAR